MKRVISPAIAIAGLAASAASLADYLAPQPQFCAASGCAAVHASAWSHPLGVPMPVIGIAFFATMLAFPRRSLAVIGGAGALALIALQAFVIGAWCKLCLVSDGAALALAISVIATKPRARWIYAPIAAVAIAVPLLWPSGPAMQPVGATPDVVAREQQPGVVTVVDFVDFECPFCRAFSTKLDAALSGAKVPVRLVRKMTPLSIHEHAMPAAIAWCCADAQGKGDAMATALFTAPPEQLTDAGCEQIARSVGCDLDRYRRDAADPAIRARIDGDLAAARAAGIHALPTVYIGDRAFTGAGASIDDLTAAIARAS